MLQVPLGQREAISVFGTDDPTPDGTAIRDYIHVNDLSRAHLLAVQACTPGVHPIDNLGWQPEYGLVDMVRDAWAFAQYRAADFPNEV